MSHCLKIVIPSRFYEESVFAAPNAFEQQISRQMRLGMTAQIALRQSANAQTNVVIPSRLYEESVFRFFAAPNAFEQQIPRKSISG